MNKLSRRDKLRKEMLKDHIEVEFTCCAECVCCGQCIANKLDGIDNPCSDFKMFKKRPEYHYTVTERWFCGKNDIHKRFIVKDNYINKIILNDKNSPYGWWTETVNLFLPKIISENNAEHVVQKVKRLKDL